MKRAYVFAGFAVLLLAASSGCVDRKEPGREKGEIVCYVNKEPILRAELKREVALRARQDPSFKFTPYTDDEQLDMMIDRKLIIQEAMDKGLAREDRFVATIKNFWEQTLIREFIDYKKREFKDLLFASNEDIASYYNNLGRVVKLKILRSRDKKYIKDSYDEFLKNKDTMTLPWQEVGPVGYEEISETPLEEIFMQPAGSGKIIEDLPDHYLVVVDSEDMRERPALEEAREDIERKVIEMKERRLFENWLKDKRKRATIKTPARRER